MITQAFILCAGMGTRMHPDTLAKPKCLLDVAGKPVLGRIADWLALHGIKDVVINLHWQPELVIDYLCTLPELRATCSVEKKLLGTAGGISAAIGSLQDSFVIVYGDVLTNMDLNRLVEFHAANDADLTMASYRVANPQDCGIISPAEAGAVARLVEKPTEFISDLANAGVMVCQREIFRKVPEGRRWDVARDLLPDLLEGGRRVFHLPLLGEEWLIDVGTRVNFLRCCDKYLGKEVTDDHDKNTIAGEFPGRRQRPPRLLP